MRAQQIPGDDRRLAYPQRQTLRLHAVGDAEDALLEKLALRPVRFLGGVGWDSAGLLGERADKGRRSSRPTCMARSPDSAAAIPNSCCDQST